MPKSKRHNKEKHHQNHQKHHHQHDSRFFHGQNVNVNVTVNEKEEEQDCFKALFSCFKKGASTAGSS